MRPSTATSASSSAAAAAAAAAAGSAQNGAGRAHESTGGGRRRPGRADLGCAGRRRRRGDHGLRVPDRPAGRLDFHRFHRHHPYGYRPSSTARPTSFRCGALNRIGRSGPSLPAEATPIAQVVLDLAHFANGAGIISEVVLVNVAPHPIRPALYFYDQEGEPIAAESMVDVLGDLGIQEDGGLTIRTEMEPLGELTISTHGRGDLVSGSVKVAAYGAIAGVLRFDLPGIGVAGVQVSQPLRDAIFPVRRREGGIDTGMALHNLREEAAVGELPLMKNGAVLEEVEITLAANGQVARFIGEVFTGTDTSDFVGLVRCTAEGVAQFTGMALELDAGNRIFTTLPVVKVNRGRAGEAALDFAHFANGASIVSEMVFMNLETQPSGSPQPLSSGHSSDPSCHLLLRSEG